MKKTITSILIAATAVATLGGVASAQESFFDGEIDPYGRVMYDQFGDVHYTDPYATDSMVDAYGNVIYREQGEFDPYYGNGDFGHLYTQDPTANFDSSSTFSSTYVPYEQPADSHEAFINWIYE